MVNHEKHFQKYSWLLKLGIWALLIIWAAQGNVAIKSFWKSGEARRKDLQESYKDPQAMEAARKKFMILGDSLYEKARYKPEYGAKDYYDDLKKLKLENKKIYFRELDEFHEEAGHLLSLFEYAHKRRLITSDAEQAKQDLWDRERDYALWLKTADVYKTKHDFDLIKTHTEPRIEKSTGESLTLLFLFILKIFCWLAITYLRGLLLVPFLYLIRIFERGKWVRGGDVEKHFLFAVILWPTCILEYPFSLLREFRVEAELRRMGQAIRKLSPSDKELVRRIANSSDYKEWLRTYRIANAAKFQRGLLIAVMLTLTVHTCGPLLITHTSDSPARDGPRVVLMDTDRGDQLKQSDFTAHDHLEQWCLPEIIDSPPMLKSEELTRNVKRATCRDAMHEIDHVPIFGCLASGFILTAN